MFTQRLKAFAKIIGGFLFVAGVIVLLGWAFDIPLLKSVFPGLVTMKANTAIGMALSGMALALLSREKVGAPLRFCTAVLAVVVIALGSLSLGEYFLGLNLGIDELLFRDAIKSVGTSQPGRMSPSSAFCFVLAGMALWSASQQILRQLRLSIQSALGATLIVLGGVASLGQISNALLDFRLWNYFGMAMHTALGFVLLGIGLLALVKSEGGMRWALDKSITIGFIISIATMLTAAGVSWNYTNQLQQTATWVSRTYEVLKEIEDVRADKANIESSQRSYLILGDEHLLAEREHLQTEVRKDIDDLRRLTADDPQQQRYLDQLEPLVAQRTDFGEKIIALRRQQGFSAAQSMLATGPGLAISGDIARVLEAMRAEENSLLVTRQKQSEAISTATFLLLPLGVFLSLTILSLALFFLNAGVDERAQAEEQIAEQAALLDKAQDAILVRDLEGKILFWNKGAERIYGWTRQEVVGRDKCKLLHANQKKFEEINGLTISQGEWTGEFQHVTKDQREIAIEARWALIRDNEGHPKSVLEINTDITERKKIEAQFMRAQRMESIGTLAGGVAHDLNNILAPIMMSIDILRTTSDSPQANQILETIKVSAKRGADIVRQVLSFARGIEGEKIEIQPKHLLKDLESIIKDTFPKNIRLHFSIPNDIWTILGDPTQVHQILLNLCVNARDAMPNGGDLTIGVENRELDEQYAAMNIQAKPGRYVNISVTDSGTGIPPEILDKIFDPFFTTKELNKGTGLGLSTVMAIVKSHEGVINVYSEPGKGTTFRVYLPAIETSSEARKEQSERVSLPRGNGETVLVVDDEASILTITSQTLQAVGYRVLTATDGADAVAVYSEHKNEIAVVLTDMMMPVMDGSSAIYALMRINPAIKIIAASGLTSTGGLVKVSGTGVKHFLTKPYTAGALLKTMRAILDEA